MTPDPCRRWREQIGALVLGGLDAEEAAVVRAHLDGCEACRREAAALAPLAPLLRRVDPSSLERPSEAPHGLGARVLARIRAERRDRRRRRTRLALALSGAAAATAVAVVAAIGVLSSPDAGGPTGRHVAFDTDRPGVKVGASLTPQSWGTQVVVSLQGVPKGTPCHVWLRSRQGERVPAGSFRYRRTGDGDYPALSTSLDLHRVRAVGVSAGPRTYVAPVGRGANAS